jgi:hypothetical protein
LFTTLLLKSPKKSSPASLIKTLSIFLSLTIPQ